MPKDTYIYQDRAVAFVDVLGFRQKLAEFEQDLQPTGANEYQSSEKVNEFITTFKEGISLLDKANFKYYLFSDNICITVDYIENPNLLESDVVKEIEDNNPDFLSVRNKGFQILLAISHHEESGKSQAKFKRISMEHYLHAVKVLIETGKIE